MFVVLVLGLVLRAAIIRMPSALQSRQSQQNDNLSLMAARSGLDYAVYRFRADPAWEGGKARKVVLDQRGLKVIEEDGLVQGEMKTEGGPTLYFRFYFKSDVDGQQMVSVNNLDSDVPAKLPRPAGEEGTFEVPPHSVCLFVEGGVGTLEDLEAEGGPKIDRGRGKIVESIYRLVPDGGVKDAVAMAAGDLSLDVAGVGGQVFLSGTYLGNAGGDALRLRSKKQIVVTRGGSGTGQLKLADRTDAELGQSYGVKADYDDSKVTLVDEYFSDGQDFYNLTWDQIPTISGSKNRQTERIPGGVYVYGTGENNQRELRYYDMSYEAYVKNARELAKSGHSSSTGGFFRNVSTISPFSSFTNTGNRLNTGLNTGNNTGNLSNPFNRFNNTGNSTNTNSNNNNNSGDSQSGTPEATLPKFKGFTFKPATVSYYPPGAGKPTKYEGFRFAVKGKNLNVVRSQNGREDLVIIPESPQKYDIGDKGKYPNIKTKYNPDHFYMTLDDSTITVPGDVIIQGGVNGRGGSIVSEGDISILAGKTLELASQGRSNDEMDRELEAQKGVVEQIASGVKNISKPTLTSASLQLNLYAKGDLTLSTFVDRTDSYRSLTFRGLLYSWGDIHVWAGKGMAAQRGTLTLQGAVVAYGDDPKSQEPGAGGGGTLDIRAKDINLAWDPRYLPSLSELQSDNRSTFALRQARIRQIR